MTCPREAGGRANARDNREAVRPAVGAVGVADCSAACHGQGQVKRRPSRRCRARGVAAVAGGSGFGFGRARAFLRRLAP